MKPHKKIAVIGAGWAGLAAAVELAPHADVVLFEAGRNAGGRARTVYQKENHFSFLDNGQHLLMGAYHAVFSLLEKVGIDPTPHTMRQAMQWYLHDGMRFQAARLPEPWHLLFGVITAKNASWQNKCALLQQMRALQLWHKKNLPNQSVEQWLQQQNASKTLIQEFWQPLVWGALNTPLSSASLRTLANVLADGVWRKRRDSDFCLPKTDLGSWLVEPVLRWLMAQGAYFVPECRVNSLIFQESGKIDVMGEDFDAVIMAVAPYHVASLLPDDVYAMYQDFYQQLQYHAITTVYLKYDQAARLPAPMVGLVNGTAQWLIDRSTINGAHEIAAVISVSDDYGQLSSAQWAESVEQDVQLLCPHLGKAIDVKVITEKRATVSAAVEREIPDFSQWQRKRLYVAGDYVHSRYPATLEAAVQTGIAAAQQCWQDLM